MIKVWSLPTRIMHWTLVCAFVVALYTRNSELMRDIHVDAGYVAGRGDCSALALWFFHARLCIISPISRPILVRDWAYLRNLAQGRAKRYIGHNPAGALAIYGMLVLGSFSIITGYMAFNDIVFPFGWWMRTRSRISTALFHTPGLGWFACTSPGWLQAAWRTRKISRSP